MQTAASSGPAAARVGVQWWESPFSGEAVWRMWNTAGSPKPWPLLENDSRVSLSTACESSALELSGSAMFVTFSKHGRCESG